MIAKIHITPKNGVLDPQGTAVAKALQGLGFQVGNVTVGKYLEVEIPDDLYPKTAETKLKEMCDKLLANPVMERYSVAVE